MKIFSFFFLFISLAIANPADEGVRLIYQGQYEAALKLLEPLAQKSNPKAAFFAALIFLYGGKSNVSRGMQLLTQAVNAGYGPALDTYAGFYLHGDFVEKDLHKAKMYYEISGRRGYGPSQFNYGILCKNGDGLPLDRETAYIFLSLAADNQQDLGNLTIDAAQFRDEIKSLLSPEGLARANQTLYQFKAELSQKKIDND
jgi:TPR repeat protein